VRKFSLEDDLDYDHNDDEEEKIEDDMRSSYSQNIIMIED
jgi:hypothetical protein